MIKKPFTILLFSLFLIACTQQRQPCVEPILVSLRFTVLSTHTIIDSTVIPPKTSRVAFDTLLPNSVLSTVGAPHNVSYFFGNATAFYLFLNPNADSCKWYLSQDSGRTIIDTITFFYQRKLQFLSNACGYTYYYNLTTTPVTPNLKNNQIQNAFDTIHKIDSITLENPGITNNVNVEHMKVYIHNPH